MKVYKFIKLKVVNDITISFMIGLFARICQFGVYNCGHIYFYSGNVIVLTGIWIVETLYRP